MNSEKVTLVTILLVLISLVLWIRPLPWTQAQQIDAAALFQQYCVLCHGPKGEGDGVMAPQLNPKPRNFKKDPFKFGDTDEDHFKIMKNGTNTGMLAFGGTLTDDQIKALVPYIKILREQK